MDKMTITKKGLDDGFFLSFRFRRRGGFPVGKGVLWKSACTGQKNYTEGAKKCIELARCCRIKTTICKAI